MMHARFWSALLVLILSLLVAAGDARAQAPVNLAFSSLGQGTAWYIYGATMADILRKALPPGSNVDVKPYAGGVGNAKLVARNETPLGLSLTAPNRWAWDGVEAYDARMDNLRSLVGGLDTYYLVAVVSKRLDISSVADIKTRRLPVRLYSQPVGSLGEFGARQLLREYGISYADLKAWGGSTTHVNYNIIIDAFRDGRADMLVAVVVPKHPSITEIVTFADVRFVGAEPERLKGLAARGWAPGALPANTFRNQPEPVPAPTTPTVLITNKDLPEPIAYTVTRALLENKEALVRGHAALAEFDPPTAWQPEKVGLPLHPGAERAYREKGWLR